MDFKQFTTPADLRLLTNEQMDELWRWANRSKHDRPAGLGINGMPLLSIGRCIEFLIDHQIPMKELMASLAADFHFKPDNQLLDLLWECIRIGLAKPKLSEEDQKRWGWIKPTELKPRGNMQQWMGRDQWKQLTDGEKARIWAWVNKTPSDTPRIFFSVHDRPMLSIGRLLEFLVENGMSLKEIFQQVAFYENKEWNKMQLIDILWERVKIVLKLPLPNALI